MSCRLPVKVVPRATRTEITGWIGDRLRVRVAAVPENGRANAELESHIAGVLGLPRANVRVVFGHKAPLKLLEIDSVDAATLAASLPAKP